MVGILTNNDFPDSRAAYAEELNDIVTAQLNKARQKLIDTLHNKNGDAPLQSEHLVNELANSFHQGNKATPLSELTLSRKTKNADGTKDTVVYTLQERIDIFAAEVEKHEKIIANITKKHDDILHQIATFVAEKLNVDDDVEEGYDAKTQLLVEGLEHEIDGLEGPELQLLKGEIEAGKAKEKKFYEMLEMLNA
jgi:iron-sulfur cluster repair protein YtfE (RIC family)